MGVHFDHAKRVFVCPELNNAYFLDDTIAPKIHQNLLNGFASL